MRLDPKSARTIAKGRLKAEAELIDQKLELARMFKHALFASGSSPSTKLNAHKNRVENELRMIYGKSYLGGGWEKRRFFYMVLEILERPNGVPPYCEVLGCNYNSRSGNTEIFVFANITMHVMERLMERREDVDPVALIIDEFDDGFFGRMMYDNLGGATDRVKPKEFELETKHGWARGIYDENRCAVIKTWIHDPQRNARSSGNASGSNETCHI